MRCDGVKWISTNVMLFGKSHESICIRTFNIRYIANQLLNYFVDRVKQIDKICLSAFLVKDHEFTIKSNYYSFLSIFDNYDTSFPNKPNRYFRKLNC